MVTFGSVLFGSLSFAAASPALVEETVYVGGYVCPQGQNAWVVRPDDDKKHPLVSFAHGAFSGGEILHQYYDHVLRGLAREGYVVVALESASFFLCRNEYKDQFHSLEWAMANKTLMEHIDVKAGTAILGQSMGGGATLVGASKSTSLQKNNVKAAVAINPCLGECLFNLTGAEPKVPTLFLTGDADDGANDVYKQYQKGSGMEKVYVEVHGGDHCNICDNNTRVEVPYVYDWVNCKLKADDAACKRVTTCSEPGTTTGGNGCHHDTGIVDVIV